MILERSLPLIGSDSLSPMSLNQTSESELLSDYAGLDHRLAWHHPCSVVISESCHQMYRSFYGLGSLSPMLFLPMGSSASANSAGKSVRR